MWMASDLRTQKEFGEKAGISASALSNYVSKRTRRPYIEDAVRLASEYQVTLDFIYLGETSGLTVQVLDKLRDALAAPDVYKFSRQEHDEKPVSKKRERA